MTLLKTIQSAFIPVLEHYVSDATKRTAYLGMIKPTNDPKHGDYQANLAMPLAKETGRPPREIAAEIAQRLAVGDFLEAPEVAGPGFINLRLRADWLARQLRTMEADPRLGIALAPKPKTVIIDFSSPNVAKPLHVGHLRSTIIGDSLKRIFQFLGHHVIADNHLGDWGTQFGMLLYGYKHFRDDAALRSDPIGELVRLYVLVRQLTKGREDDEGDVTRTEEEAAHYARCLEETRKLQSGDPENVAIWQQFVRWTMETVEPIYRLLDVTFDYYFGESFYKDMLPEVVQSLLSCGIAERSEGAVVLFLSPSHEGAPRRADAVIQKKDGAFTYMTSDLACVKYRMERWHPDAILYVVGTPQSQHFQTLFETVRRWGYGQSELRHINFGSVLGNDRKMLSTRNGGAAALSDLLAMAVARGGEKYEQTRQERLARGEEVPELDASERQAIAEAVGIGAVKYADLAQNRVSDYVFSLEKMLSTDGNTATYMQYAYTRCRGILRKGNIDAERLRQQPPPVQLTTTHERSLGVQLCRFGDAVEAAAEEYAPHLLTGYLWDLARSYSRFFENCPVLRAESNEVQQSRLVLVDLTARVIQKALNLLGIRTLERM
jgi:arginyl-tRNA synthetase